MAATEPSAFGVLLRQYRVEAGLTQEELAERAQLSARVISNLERGVTQVPRQYMVRQLADALSLSDEERSRFKESARSESAGPDSPTDAPGGSEQLPRIQTFLIADIRGYTAFTLERGDEAAAKLARTFATLGGEAVEAHGGQVVELRGDELLAAFPSAREALRAAVDVQQRCAQATESDPSLPLRVGIGLDAGEAIAVLEGYRGGALNLAARLCALAGAGEVLASETVIGIARKLEDVTYVERGLGHLKGFADPVQVIQILPAGAPALPSTATPTGEVETERLPIGGFLGALPSAPLVARDAELARIEGTIDEVIRGNARLVLLAGEPGAGKTRLAQEVSLTLRNRGCLVAIGVCYEPRRAVPYYPFLDALAALYAAAPPTVRSQVGFRWPYLGRLLPDMGIGGSIQVTEDQEAQERLIRAVTSFVQAVAQERPVAFLIDDLHWADGASLDLLQHLARHTRGHRILLLGTYRDVEVGREHPLEPVLLDLGRDQLLDRLAVRRLPQEGTAALMATILGGGEITSELSTAVHRQTEGNPLFTQQVLRALVEQGDIYWQNGQWVHGGLEELVLPESVRAVIRQRISRLAAPVQELLQTASVLGQNFHFEDLQALTHRSEEEVDAGLAEAGERGLVRLREGEEYGFNHALTQQSLYAELSPRRRKRLHLAAGEAFEGLPERQRKERAAELAWHFLEGNDQERARVYALLAGEQATAVFAYTEAERHYRTAVELARAMGTREREVETLEKLGDALAPQGRYEEARGAYEAALALVHGDDRLWQSRLHRKIGDTWASFGAGLEFDKAIHAYDVAERALGEEPDQADVAWRRTWVDLQFARMGPYYSVGRLPETAELLERVRQVVEDVGTPHQRVGVFFSLASLAQQRSRYAGSEEAVRYGQEALAATEEVGDPGVIAEAQFTLGFHHLWHRDLDEAEQLFQVALGTAQRIADAEREASCLAYLTTLYRKRGEVDTVREYDGRVQATAPAAGMPQYVAMADAHLAWAAWRNGDLDEAEAKAQAALERWHAGQMDYRPFHWMAVWPLLGVAVARKQVAEAIEHARALRVPTMQPMPTDLATAVESALAAWDRGDREAASSQLQAAIRLARVEGYL